jgi:hypothetical protein
MAERKNLKPPGKCIFCEGGAVPGNKMSREHLWSDWMAKGNLLPKTAEYVEIQKTFRRRTTKVIVEASRSRQGHAGTKKIGGVCEECNSEWMSRLETAVKSTLIPLIKGESFILDVISRGVLARWITLKALVAEHDTIGENQKDPIFSQAERTRFYNDRTMPPGIKIWLAKQNGSTWATGYHRHATGLSAATIDSSFEEPSPVTPKNLQTITWGIGKLLVLFHAATDPGVYVSLDIDRPDRLIPLWPLQNGNIIWPPTFVFNDAMADDLAEISVRLVESKQVIRPWETS